MYEAHARGFYSGRFNPRVTPSMPSQKARYPPEPTAQMLGWEAEVAAAGAAEASGLYSDIRRQRRRELRRVKRQLAAYEQYTALRRPAHKTKGGKQEKRQ